MSQEIWVFFHKWTLILSWSELPIFSGKAKINSYKDDEDEEDQENEIEEDQEPNDTFQTADKG